MPIGHPSLAAFFAAAEDLSASIFVHALRPTGHERLIGPTALGAALLFPCDVALAASSMLTGGIIARHPNLRLAFSHGGGAFGLLLPRLAHMWRKVPSIRELMNEDPLDAARRLYYDTLVYDKDTLTFLIQRFGADRLLVGSDYPYQIHEPDPVGRINDLTLAPTDRQALIRENAITFLGLKVVV
jgi:aminocarboxymuconate-semialdehyde decarboxylase